MPKYFEPRNRHERRTAKARLKQRGYLKDFDLTSRAFTILTQNLTRYGNSLTDKHREALMAIVGRFTLISGGITKGRYAFDLPCGGGKTQAVIAWCAALAQLAKPFSVAICASKVEELCAMKRAMIANGVPEEMIGVVHSYKFNPEMAEAARQGEPKALGYASEPSTDGNKRILLVTHERVRGGNDLERITHHQGKPRNLAIWDESLIHSRHRAVEAFRIEQGLGFARPIVNSGRGTQALEEALAYLDTANTKLTEEMERQRETHTKPRVVYLERLETETLERFEDAIEQCRRQDPKRGACLAEIEALLGISQEPLRAVASNQGKGGYVHYQIAVPSEFKNVAVLDASWPIRDLERMDETIRSDPSFNGDVTRYDNVTVHHLKHASGRAAMRNNFSQRREARTISAEIVAVLKNLPEDEAAIIWTFKPRDKLDMAEVLISDLKAAGIDPDATLPDGQKRFVWLTWGRETAISEFSYCRNVVFAGVLHRSDIDLAGAIVGQRDDLTSNVTAKELREVRLSEVAYSLHQAMSRGSCRVNRDGYADRMNVWLPYPNDDLKPLIARVMPGVQWTEWMPKHMAPKTTKVSEIADQIAAYLKALPEGTDKISIRRVKAGAGITSLPFRTFTRARDAALDKLSEWHLQGRSLVRAT